MRFGPQSKGPRGVSDWGLIISEWNPIDEQADFQSMQEGCDCPGCGS